MIRLPEPGTRKSRRTGHPVKPQKATMDAWLDTFSEWDRDRQVLAIVVCEQIVRIKQRYLSSPSAQQTLPQVTDE